MSEKRFSKQNKYTKLECYYNAEKRNNLNFCNTCEENVIMTYMQYLVNTCALEIINNNILYYILYIDIYSSKQLLKIRNAKEIVYF